jgi:cellulose synthase operon protein C
MRIVSGVLSILLATASCARPAASGSAPVAAPLEECRTFEQHGKRVEAKACFTRLSRLSDPFLQAEGFWKLQQFDEANSAFRQASASSPNPALVKTEWGRLFAERFNEQEAAKLYQEALEADPNYAPAYLEFARILSENFDKRSVDLANEALKRDPKLFGAHELLAYLALEDSNRNLAREEAEKALAISPEAIDALSILASIDWIDGKGDTEYIARLLRVNPNYGKAYETGAHFLSINYRYSQAVDFYRKALALDDRSWSARSQLGINLMRLGMEDQAKKELELCYNAHYRNAQTVNSLRLLDSLQNFQLFENGTTQVLLNKKEAQLLLPYVQDELRQAMTVYEGKYKMHLPGPVRLEVYPNHEDFIVRTLGLPGQAGLLGVTFGTVVAMDSPSARAAGEFKWSETLWHELSHVYVVTATHELVPRWFTEGLAVHEEGVASPQWGDRLTPDIISALKDKKLLPVLALDRGFVRQDYPNQVLVSYYQAGKICDFIGTKWGDAALLGMIHSYADRKSTAEAIEANLHESPENFDREFTAWLNEKTSGTVNAFDHWKKTLQEADAALRAGRREDAVKLATSIESVYPDYVGHDSTYQLLSSAYISLKDNAAAIRELEKYRDAGGSDLATLKQLAKLEEDAHNLKAAESTLRVVVSIFPEDEEVHRKLGSILLAESQAQPAVQEFSAVLNLNPADTAEAHFNLARALSAAHRTSEAKDQVLVALEAAPDYKPAQQLLLKLSQ